MDQQVQLSQDSNSVRVVTPCGTVSVVLSSDDKADAVSVGLTGLRVGTVIKTGQSTDGAAWITAVRKR